MQEQIRRIEQVGLGASDDAFTVFATEVGQRLRIALSARFGPELGGEATADALLYAWQHWERVRGLGNPAGYLYRVGSRRATRSLRRDRKTVLQDLEPAAHTGWVEPDLHDALQTLPERQRTAALLVHAFEWTLAEVAQLWGVRRSTVQRHVDRAMTGLRSRLGVDNDG